MPFAAYAVIGLLILAIGGGVVYTYNSAITKAEELEAENKNLIQTNKDNAEELTKRKESEAKKDKLLAIRQAERNTQAAVERKVDEALSKVLQRPENQAWATSIVPAAVVDSLRNELSTDKDKDGKGISTGKSTDTTKNP